MARAATTSDVFNAIAEPKRREIVAWLAGGAKSVNDLVEELGIAQPAVSKHLAVLRVVGVVTVEKSGKNRLYSLNPAELKPVLDWVKPYEQYWTHQLDRIKQRAERKAKERAAKPDVFLRLMGAKAPSSYGPSGDEMPDFLNK